MKHILTVILILCPSIAHGQFTIKVGDIHEAEGFSAKIRQVLTGNKLFVDLHITGFEKLGTAPVMLKVPTTTNLVDNQVWEIKDLTKIDKFKVTGTESFTNVLGAKSTVFTVEGVSLKPGEKTIEQVRREEEQARQVGRLADELARQRKLQEQAAKAKAEAEERARARAEARAKANEDKQRREQARKEAAAEPEVAAARKLKLLKQVIADLDHAAGEQRERLIDLRSRLLDELLDKYASTKAGKEAQDILSKK
jgi:hypothetical protein